MEATLQLNQLSSLGPGPGKSQTIKVSIQTPQSTRADAKILMNPPPPTF